MKSHGNYYKNISLGWFTYSAEVQSIINMMGHGGIQVDMVLKRELEFYVL